MIDGSNPDNDVYQLTDKIQTYALSNNKSILMSYMTEQKHLLEEILLQQEQIK